MDNENFVYYGYVNIYDKVFTKERLNKWKNHIISSYEIVYNVLQEKIDNSFKIKFHMNPSLLKEVIWDGVIGMKKITDSEYNSVEDPNTFKIAAYLSYWFLRHKPISFYCSKNQRLEDLELFTTKNLEAKQLEDERQKLIWQVKHINELVAVQMVSTFIFDFEKQICSSKRCKNKTNNFSFEDFDDMLDVFLRKLTYYFSYRAIAPKVIEHLLEAYTFHPAWDLTGVQWQIEKDKTLC